MNTNFVPALSNAKGDAGWTTDGDPFVGVESFFYWSATEAGAGDAWDVALGNGNVNTGDQLGDAFVWPVRSGQ